MSSDLNQSFGLDHQDELENQLSESLIESSENDTRVGESTNILQKNIGKDNYENAESNKYQIPADLNQSNRRWNFGGIHQTKSKESPEITLENNSTEKLVPEPEKIPFFSNPLKLTGYGTTIQLYYLFNLCCLSLLVVGFLGSIYPTCVFRSLYCSQYLKKNGKACSLFDLDSYKINTYDLIFEGETLDTFKNQAIYGAFYTSFFVILMVFVIFVFAVLKVKLCCAYRDQREESRASEFTILVEGVDAELGIEPVIEFIQWLVDQGHEKFEFRVSNSLVASSKGEADRAGVHLNQAQEDLERVQKMKEEFQNEPKTEKSDGEGSLSDQLDPELIQKSYSKLEKRLSNKVKRLTKRVEWLQKPHMNFVSRDKNSIALISFETNVQRDLILEAYDNIYDPKGFIWWLTCCCQKKPQFRISKAPEPSEIKWNKLGHSSWEKIL